MNRLLTVALGTLLLSGTAMAAAAGDPATGGQQPREAQHQPRGVGHQLDAADLAGAGHHRPVGDGGIGPVPRRIMDAYFEAVKGKNPDYQDWVVPVY